MDSKGFNHWVHASNPLYYQVPLCADFCSIILLLVLSIKNMSLLVLDSIANAFLYCTKVEMQPI
jgi:hypothetical protein